MPSHRGILRRLTHPKASQSLGFLTSHPQTSHHLTDSDARGKQQQWRNETDGMTQTQTERERGGRGELRTQPGERAAEVG